MRKRFLDADINNKSWFRKLTADQKVLWYYIMTSCTHDGFWEFDEQAIELLQRLQRRNTRNYKTKNGND